MTSKSALPSTSVAKAPARGVRVRLAQRAEGTRSLKEMMERTMGDPAQWEPNELKKQRSEITGAEMLFVRQRAEFSDQMDKRVITRYERRRVQIRKEVERYFGD